MIPRASRGFFLSRGQGSDVSSSESITDVQNNIVVLQERLERLEQNQASMPLDGASKQQFTRAGKVILRSKELDYSLIEIYHPLASLGDLENNTIELSDVSRIEPCCRDAAVKATIPDGGIVGGALSGTPSYVRLPQSRTYVEVYFARFNRPFVPGDCCSWVRDAVTGRLFGHVFAGSPTSGLTMIMPACHVFENARNILDSQSCGTGTKAIRELAGEVEMETHQNQDTLPHPPSSEIVFQERSCRFYHLPLREYQREDIQKLAVVVNAKYSGAPPGPHVMEQLAAFKHGSELSFLLPWPIRVNAAELWRQKPLKVLSSIVDPSEAHTKWFVEQRASIARGLRRTHQVESRINDACSCRQGRKDYDHNIHRDMKLGDPSHYFHKKKLPSHIISRAQFWKDFVWLLAGLRHLHAREPDSSDQGPRHHR